MHFIQRQRFIFIVDYGAQMQLQYGYSYGTHTNFIGRKKCIVIILSLIQHFPLGPCDSWRWFRSHWRKANSRFAYLNGKMQIGDLLFSCASWIFIRRHKKNGIQEENKRLALAKKQAELKVREWHEEMNANETYRISGIYNIWNNQK